MVPIILLTVSFTLLVLGVITHQLYLKYKHPSINLWLLHPLFLFNGIVVLTFFIPYLFQALFGTVEPNLSLLEGNNEKDLVLFCGSLILFNFFFLFLEKLPKGRYKRKERRELKVKKKDLFLISILLVAIFLGHILSVWSNIYYFGPLAQGKQVLLSLGKAGPLRFLLANLRKFVLVGLSLLYFTKFRNNQAYKIFFWFLVGINFILAFPSGSKSLILMPLLIFAFCYLVFTKRNLWKAVLIGTVFLALFFSFYNVWRNWAAQQKEGLRLDYGKYWRRKALVRKKGGVFFVVNNFMQRLDTFSNYLILTDHYPKRFQFLKGRSYLVTLTSPIPRWIFPSKPTALDDNEIGRKTGLIAKDNFNTNPAIPWWAEGYINFGYPGIFLVPFLALVFYQVFFHFWLRHRKNFLVITTYLTFLLYIPFTIAAGIGALFGDFLKFLVFLTPLFLIIYLPRKNENRN